MGGIDGLVCSETLFFFLSREIELYVNASDIFCNYTAPYWKVQDPESSFSKN